MTWIDVVDSAVKIGLGALIGGIITILSINLTHRNQLIQKRDERLAKVLEDVSHQVENVCSGALAGFLTFGYDSLIKTVESGSREQAKQAMRDIQESQFERNLKFQELMGMLRLYGCVDAAYTLGEISDKFGELTEQFSSALETQSFNIKLEPNPKSIENLKLKFYKELNKKIDNPH